MATSNDVIAARNDPNLLARMQAIATRIGAQGIDHQIATQMGALVTTPIGEGQCIADVLAYATSKYVPAPLPGADLTAVTDDHLETALRAVLTIPENPQA